MGKQTISALNGYLDGNQLKLYDLSVDSLVLDQSLDGLKTANNPLHVDLVSNFQFLMGEMEILRKENAELARENHDLKKQNAELVLINKDLNSRLALYENPHTPPSSVRRVKKKKKKGESISQKRCSQGP